jgi:phosphate transport system protein
VKGYCGCVPSELRIAFHRNLEEIDAKVAHLFVLVSEAVAAATECLLTGDRAMAEVLVEGDAHFDELADEVEALAERQLTLQTPMGADLRYLLSIVRMVPELERSADLAEHIAARAAGGLTGMLTPRLRGLIEQMGRVAVKMWRDATEAFADRDPDAAERLFEADEELDTLHNYLTAELVSGAVGVSVALEMALVGRFYERLGDHAEHVTRRVRFLAGELGSVPRPSR